jgi:uncharacterized protein YgbK (DUF1537 family)
VTRVNCILLEDEVIPLVAYGRFMGGYFENVPLIIKGGMIGQKDIIYNSVKFLQTK